jgi:hypothetical protein
MEAMDEIIVLTLETRILSHPDPYIEITGCSLPQTDRTTTPDAQRGTCVDAGGDLDRIGAFLDDPPVSRATLTTRCDDGAEPVASTTGTGGDHLPEDGLAYSSYLSCAVAVRAGARCGPTLGSGSVAVLTGDSGSYGDIGGCSEHSLFEIDLNGGFEILAGRWSGRPLL